MPGYRREELVTLAEGEVKVTTKAGKKGVVIFKRLIN